MFEVKVVRKGSTKTIIAIVRTARGKSYPHPEARIVKDRSEKFTEEDVTALLALSRGS